MKPDPNTYKLEMKMNSSIQTLSLSAFGNYELSVCIPGFESSSFVPLKAEGDDDYEISTEPDNYVRNMFESDINTDLQPEVE